ncbi:preprotein translocase subunit SecG [Parvibium lacunae]|uniref:Protein-export membrane protein SecG n=1 Tax=Parvibium lacunae TaxID=1888893 RepID=A0A368L517_9BURK|nr:preprotein translocase subunit SecG [Parvibium lacunae]
MNFLHGLLVVLQVVSALGVIVLVLLQHGKGADMGAAFGGGSSGSLFGATGSANFLSRTTGVLATIFFVATLGITWLATVQPKQGESVVDRVRANAQEVAPAAPQTNEIPK